MFWREGLFFFYSVCICTWVYVYVCPHLHMSMYLCAEEEGHLALLSGCTAHRMAIGSNDTFTEAHEYDPDIIRC